MDYIEAERGRLWDEYVKLADRLRHLDDIERPTLPPLQFPKDASNAMWFGGKPTGEPVDLSNKDYITGTPLPLSSDEPGEGLLFIKTEADVDEFEHAKNAMNMDDEEKLVVAEEDEEKLADLINKYYPDDDKTDYNAQKEILKDIDFNNRAVKTPTRNSGYRDIKVIAQYAKAILKEAGIPLKTAELIKRLEDANINTSSPYSLMQNIRKHEPNIIMAGRGYYQYKW